MCFAIDWLSTSLTRRGHLKRHPTIRSSVAPGLPRCATVALAGSCELESPDLSICPATPLRWCPAKGPHNSANAMSCLTLARMKNWRPRYGGLEIRYHLTASPLTSRSMQDGGTLSRIVVHQLFNPVRDALCRLPQLLHRPVRSVALGHVARPRVVDQALGQRAG